MVLLRGVYYISAVIRTNRVGKSKGGNEVNSSVIKRLNGQNLKVYTEKGSIIQNKKNFIEKKECGKRRVVYY